MSESIGKEYVRKLTATLADLPYETIERVAGQIAATRGTERKVLILGNGGSAATASHMACDLGKGTHVQGISRLRVLSITDNMSLITAAGNDLGYENIFQEQLDILLNPDDIVIAISASGNSANVLKAIEFAKQEGAITIGFVGFDGGALANLVDEVIWIDSCDYGQVEDIHLIINHILTVYLREQLPATHSHSTN